MERTVMCFARLSLSVILLLSLWLHCARGGRVLNTRMLGELPPCKDVWGGIPGWDCFDPPTHDLPPCDFHHQRAGFDCWPKSPPKAKATALQTGGASAAHVEAGALPPCKVVLGGIQNRDCYDPRTTPLPPCDFKHQNPAIDCSTDSQKPRE